MRGSRNFFYGTKWIIVHKTYYFDSILLSNHHIWTHYWQDYENRFLWDITWYFLFVKWSRIWRREYMVTESEILTGQFQFYFKNAECANRYVRQKTKYKSITFSAQVRKHFSSKRLALSCLEVVHYMEVHDVQNPCLFRVTSNG